MIERRRHLRCLEELLGQFPVVAIIGARQVGKTTLARQFIDRRAGRSTVFDLENPAHRVRMEDGMLALQDLDGLVVIDEVQHRPELFSILRVLADRPGTPARFLVLGSASPELLRQSSESLAGRIAHYELAGLTLDEIDSGDLNRLWVRGGFPLSLLAASEAASVRWRDEFIRTFLERDLPELGINLPSATLRRLWTMLAHAHGQIWNASAFGRSLGVADHTVRRYLDLLTSTFVVRQLQPWHENVRKRQVKAPKVFVADSGLLHALLNLDDFEDVLNHPTCGASWEGFALTEVTARLDARPREIFFWATHAGAEIDLVIIRGRRRLGFEFKRTVAPRITRSMRIALEDLRLDHLDVVHAGDETYPLAERIRAVALSRLWQDLEKL